MFLQCFICVIKGNHFIYVIDFFIQIISGKTAIQNYILAVYSYNAYNFSWVKNGHLWWRMNTVIYTHSTKYPTPVNCEPSTDNKSKTNAKKQFVILSYPAYS